MAIELIEVLVEGLQGPKGVGGNLPAGGAAGQVAAKNSGEDYDVVWADLPITETGQLPMKSGYLGGDLPIISRVSPTSISIGGGVFTYLNTESLPAISVEEKVFAGVTEFTLTSSPLALIAYIYLDVGTLQIVEAQVEPSAKDVDWVYLGNIDYASGDISANPIVETAYSAGSTYSSIAFSHGNYNLRGCKYYGKLGLSLGHTAGLGIRVGGNTIANPRDPDRVPTTEDAISFLVRAYTNEVGDLVISSSPNEIDPTMYSDKGVLKSVGESKWTVQYLYHFYGSDVALVYYGTKLHVDEEKALASIIVPPLDVHGVTKEASFRAIIVVRGGATNLNDPLDANILSV